MGMKQSETIYRQWLGEKELDPVLRRELLALAGNEKEIEERFYTELEFGTAGLRGIIGAGTNRMNVHVVRRATEGLAKYIRTFADGPARGVAIVRFPEDERCVRTRDGACACAERNQGVSL